MSSLPNMKAIPRYDVAEDVVEAVTGRLDPDKPRLLADGCLGGILAAYLWTLSAALLHPNPYNFLLIIYLPVALLFGAIVGTLVGGILWFCEYLPGRKLGFLLRVLVGTAFFSFANIFLISAFGGIPDARRLTEALGELTIFGLFLSVPTAVFAGLKVSPWRLLIRGVRKTALEASGLALFSGAALRLLSICGLFISAFCFACVWPFLREPDTSIFVAVMLYFAVSTGTAYTCPRRSIALLVGLLANASMFVIILRPTEDLRFLAVLTLIYGVLWAAFIVGRGYVKKQFVAPPADHLPTVR